MTTENANAVSETQTQPQPQPEAQTEAPAQTKSKTKKPVSQRKRDANRANARKSTGPKTAQGKAVSSLNAVKQGLLARSLILKNDPVETEEQFHSMLNAIIDRLKPEGPVEMLMVERVAACLWRLARASRFETNAVQQARENEDSPWAEMDRNLNGRAYNPTRHVIPAHADLDRLLRYEALIDRELHRAMSHFLRLRERRLALTPQTQPETPASDDAEEEEDWL